MRDRVRQLQGEADQERADNAAHDAAWQALNNIENIAENRGDMDLWQRAQERAIRPDGSIDVNYVNQLRTTLRNRIGRDIALPDEPPTNWIAEGLQNTWDDFRHNPLVRIGAGVLTGGASEVAYQAQGAWEAMQRSFNEAADAGRAWDLTDALRAGYGQFAQENLPLNTWDALHNPNATWGDVVLGAGMDVFTGMGLWHTANNLRGSLNALQAGEGAWNVLTQGGGGRNPFRPTTAEGAAVEFAAERAVGRLRSPAGRLLTEGEIAQLTTEFQEIGGDPGMLRFNQGGRTGFVDELNVINVRGDALPSPYGTTANARLSSRAALAHEFYGHAAHRGTTLSPGAWNDEFRASYRAALTAPGLSAEERRDLMLDAIERAQEAGVSIRPNQTMRRIIHGY
jgi:hypothetical protein